MAIDRYPLTWPAGWKRTATFNRDRAKFHKNKEYLSVSQGTQRVLYELERLGVHDREIIISTNVQVRRDGLPYSNRAEPSDPGVAVYWKKGVGGQSQVMAIDRYDRVADNLAAVAATLEAMRQIERHGGATILDRAFTGFEALPAPKDWRDILSAHGVTDVDEVRSTYRKLASVHHPDVGGSHERMAEINQAWDDAQKELS